MLRYKDTNTRTSGREITRFCEKCASGDTAYNAKFVRVARRRVVTDVLRLQLARVQTRRKVLRLARPRRLEQKAAPGQVGERERIVALVSKRAALGRVGEIGVHADGLAQGLAGRDVDAADARLELAHDRVIDERVGHRRRVREHALHQPTAIPVTVRPGCRGGTRRGS